VYTLVDFVIADITRSNVFLHVTFPHHLLTLEVSHVKERRCVKRTIPDIDSLLGDGNCRFTIIPKLNILYTYALTQTTGLQRLFPFLDIIDETPLNFIKQSTERRGKRYKEKGPKSEPEA
jgi:hypothetical protein